MKTERRTGISWVWLGAGVFALIVFASALGVVTGARRQQPEPLHPLMAIATPRVCDFVGILADAFAVCDDGTSWFVEVLAQAEQRGPTTYANDPPDSQVEEGITVGIDDADGEEMTIRYSWYWPPLLGANCARAVGGKCVSKMRSGIPWQDGVNTAVACPEEWNFGTKVTLDGKTWECLDTGGKIKYVDGIPWVDFMVEHPAYVYGTLVEARVRFVR